MSGPGRSLFTAVSSRGGMGVRAGGPARRSPLSISLPRLQRLAAMPPPAAPTAPALDPAAPSARPVAGAVRGGPAPARAAPAGRPPYGQAPPPTLLPLAGDAGMEEPVEGQPRDRSSASAPAAEPVTPAACREQ